MSQLEYQRDGTSSVNFLETRCLLICADGTAWQCSGSPANHKLVPLDVGAAAALKKEFGPLWIDAMTAVAALGKDNS